MAEILELLEKDDLPFYEDREKVLNMTLIQFEKNDKALPLKIDNKDAYLVPNSEWIGFRDSPTFTVDDIIELQDMSDVLRMQTISVKMAIKNSAICKKTREVKK